MRTRSALVLATVVLGSMACKHKPPSGDVIQSDPMSTKDAGPQKTSAAWERLGSFTLPAFSELVGIDRDRFRAEQYGHEDYGGPRQAVFFLDGKGKVLVKRAILPDCGANTSDGRIQFVLSSKGTERVDVDTKIRTPWKKSGYPDDVSADGKLVVTTNLEVYDIATEKLLCKLAPPWAGGSEGIYRFESGGRWLTLLNSRGSYFIDPVACKGAPLPIGQRFRFSASGDVIVEIPHRQFAVGWSDKFIVVDGKTGDALRELPLKIPEPAEDPDAEAPPEPRFDAALTPKGDRLAVVYARELIVLRTSDGKELHRESVADLVAKDDAAVVVVSDGELAISSARKVTRFALPAP